MINLHQGGPQFTVSEDLAPGSVIHGLIIMEDWQHGGGRSSWSEYRTYIGGSGIRRDREQMA